MPLNRAPNLRAMLSVVALIVTAMALVIAGTLLALTQRLDRTTLSLTNAVESVHLAEKAQTALLLHARSVDPLVRNSLMREVDAHLSDAARYITTPQEMRMLNLAVSRVRDLSEGGETPARESSAHAALVDLVNVNIDEARRVQARAGQWNELATMIAGAISIILMGLTAIGLWWLQSRAFQPMFRIAEAMARFGQGDRNARAPETGPPEFRDMAARFNQMASALAAQYGAQTAFLGGVAHDLRTPLGVLMLQMDFVRPDKPLPAEEVIRRVFEMVRRQIARMERMLGDLVGTATVESGTLQLRSTREDLRRLVTEVARLFEDTSLDHRIRLKLPDQPVPVRCDPLRIEQVITNLLSNAIKYSSTGGLIEIELGRRENEAMLAVADQGMGISPEDRQRLFEPFRRVGLSTETIPGVGLGLFVVHKIVELHAGRIEVESTPGKGSTFRIFLPLDDPGPDPAGAAAVTDDQGPTRRP